MTKEELMISAKYDLKDALHKHFGFSNFKGNQEEIIENLLEGRDTFVIMPTGGGKSMCYQLPALLKEGTALIISPLIALMKNQVDAIRGHSEKNDVAHFLNSSLTKREIAKVKEDVQSGATKMLYVAPETLVKEENIAFLRNIQISFVAVDEAHCISEWGHDFRPEYRRIKEMINAIGSGIPIIALTATATPKVQSDIVKNLGISNERIFISSFNRDNLYYEVRPKKSKEETIKQIIQIIKKVPGQSGIIYVQSRKSTEEISKMLQVNDIKSAPYHAGLDSKTRSRIQDEFLMEDIDVICATIAFGMGIDKPDVRFVIHYDIPKSIENYYQETGRAGRDGLKAECHAFYSYKDINKLEKFLRDKPVSEREMGAQLLEEVVAYTENSSCRRKFLLHYFGEEFNEARCEKMCDNCKNPKDKKEAGEDLHLSLKVLEVLKENFLIKSLVDFCVGKNSKEMKDFRFDQSPLFGKGKEKGEFYWQSVYRQAMLQNFVYKEIEEYGIVKIAPKGHAFLKKPGNFILTLNHDYTKDNSENIIVANGSGGAAALDQTLFKMLKDLRLQVAKKNNVKPWVVFQEPSLEDMATQYPISQDDMGKISGVSKGKANRYGKPFVEAIKEYVEINDIERPTNFIMKQVANKSKIKVNIIQSVDRKIPLHDIAESNNISMEDLLDEMDMIVQSGTKLNIDYYLEDSMDEFTREDIYEYFMEADSDDVKDAFNELSEDDITMEEIQLIRVKFLSEMAN